MQESVDILNGLNNLLKNDYIMECSRTCSDVKTSNTSQATERMREYGEVIAEGREVKEHCGEYKRKVKNVGQRRPRLKKNSVGENKEDRG